MLCMQINCVWKAWNTHLLMWCFSFNLHHLFTGARDSWFLFKKERFKKKIVWWKITWNFPCFVKLRILLLMLKNFWIFKAFNLNFVFENFWCFLIQNICDFESDFCLRTVVLNLCSAECSFILHEKISLVPKD